MRRFISQCEVPHGCAVEDLKKYTRHKCFLILQDVVDDNPDLFSEESNKNHRSVSVDLSESNLLIDISDAVSERDKVKFTVHTKVRSLMIL